jgi:hypothetical protein
MIRWDLWEFRNGILHAPTGPLAVAKHSFLNSLIGEDFTRGKDGIDKHYYYLFEGDNTIEKLQAADITTKEQWLQTLLSARQDYEPPEAIITKESRLRRQMHVYLVSIGVRETGKKYHTPGQSSAPTTDDPTISEEYLQDAMEDWLKADNTESTTKSKRRDRDTNDTTNNDNDSEEATSNSDTSRLSQNPTSDTQEDYFRRESTNRLPTQPNETQRRHYKFLPLQRKTYTAQQREAPTILKQRQISGWLL